MIVTPLVDPAILGPGTGPGDAPTAPEAPFSQVLASALDNDAAPDGDRLDESGTDAEPAALPEADPDLVPDDAVGVDDAVVVLDDAVVVLGLPTVVTSTAAPEPELNLLQVMEKTDGGADAPHVDASADSKTKPTNTEGQQGSVTGQLAGEPRRATLPGPSDLRPDLGSDRSPVAEAITTPETATEQPVGPSGSVVPKTEMAAAYDPGTEVTEPMPSPAGPNATEATPAGVAVDPATTTPPARSIVPGSQNPGGHVAAASVQDSTQRLTTNAATRAEATRDAEPGPAGPSAGPVPTEIQTTSGSTPDTPDAASPRVAAPLGDPAQQVPTPLDAPETGDGAGKAGDITIESIKADVLRSEVDAAPVTAAGDTASGHDGSASGDLMGQASPNQRQEAAPTTNRPLPEAGSVASPTDSTTGDVAPVGQTVTVDLGAAVETTPSNSTNGTQRSGALPATLQSQLNDMRQAGETQRRLVVRLDPPELGSVTLELVNTGDELLITARTDTQDAVRALMRQREELQTVIETLGMSLAGFDVREESQQQHDQQRRSSRLRSAGLFTNPDATELGVMTDHEGAIFL